jgi:hypothetical protein
MDAVFQAHRVFYFALQLGTSFHLGTSEVKKIAIWKDLVGAVGINPRPSVKQSSVCAIPPAESSLTVCSNSKDSSED